MVELAMVPELTSPSSQKKFDRCRLLGQLQYIEHWEPREAERSLPARLRGTAFSKACELIHKALMNKTPELLDNLEFTCDVVEQAIGVFDRQYAYCEEKGVVFIPESDVLSRAELRRVIPLYAHHTPVRQWQAVTGAEVVWKEYGCRPDVVGINALGMNVVGDVKYKSALESRYVSNTIEEFHWDPQFLQYNYALQQTLKTTAPVYSSLILVVGSGFKIQQIDWLYDPENVQLWLESAKDMSLVVRGIRDGTILPRAATTHKDNYGWCSMKDACLTYHLDPELMKRKYVQLDELPE